MYSAIRRLIQLFQFNSEILETTKKKINIENVEKLHLLLNNPARVKNYKRKICGNIFLFILFTYKNKNNKTIDLKIITMRI